VRRFAALLVAGAAAALVVTSLSFAKGPSAKTTIWTAALSAGQEVPKQVVKAPAAHGLFRGTVTGNTLRWTLTFSKLSGKATAAHIHLGAKGVAGQVVIALCGPCASGVTGVSPVTPTVRAAFNKHRLYVNVHTRKNPNGEIRGQIAAG
jgi:hypothetical protein